MLIPRFTIRQLLVIIAVFGGFSAILGFAARGSIVAYAAGIVVIGSVVPLFVMALLYWTLLGLVRVLPGGELPIGATLPSRADLAVDPNPAKFPNPANDAFNEREAE